MNNFKYVRKIGLWVIAGLTLLTLLVLNVIQETGYLNLVVGIAVVALIGWLVAVSVISLLNVRKGHDK